VALCPLSSKHLESCKERERELRQKGFEVFLDDSGSTLNKKIRNAQLQQFNYIAVVGPAEEEEGSVDVRSRSGERLVRAS